MLKKSIIITSVILGLFIQSGTLWADDDAIMDIDNHSAAFTGNWGFSTNKLLYYGDDYRYAFGAGTNVGTPTKEAIFTTAQIADITGTYAVYVRWSASSNREESATFRVYDGITPRGSCSKNQTANGGEWQYCRSVTLTAGQRGVVKLGNEYTDTNEVVIADAVRFVRVSKDAADLVGLRSAGIDYSGRSSRSINTIGTSSLARTNLASDSITAPAGGTGYVLVQASGFASLSTADKSIHLCIDNASGGSTCDSYQHTLENTADETNAGTYENRREFHIQEAYSITGGTTNSYYLKAYIETGATGTVYWDDFVLLYVPSFY